MMFSPTLTFPEARVPVMTVPNPFMEKTLSTGRRKMGEKGLSGIALQVFSSVLLKRSSPRFLVEDTGTTGASSRNVPRVNSLISSRASSMSSSSTMSILVMAMKPCLMPMREQISICSRVCGMTPSSAAMTMETRSIPLAPATMFFTNFS